MQIEELDMRYSISSLSVTVLHHIFSSVQIDQLGLNILSHFFFTQLCDLNLVKA
jgi:hypothetical protein